jgi:hypothetical protein
MRAEQIMAGLAKMGLDSHPTSNGWVESACPFAPWRHKAGEDRRPSFGVAVRDDGRSGYKCHSCGSHGLFQTLPLAVSKAGGWIEGDHLRMVDMSESFKEAEAGAIELDCVFDAEPEPLLKEAYSGIWPAASAVDVAMAYLRKRGIFEECANALGLLYDDEQCRIIFQVWDREGNLWGFTGRSIIPGERIKVRDYHGLPKSRCILGSDRWEPGKPVLIVEGLFGFAHLVEIGAERFCNVGATMGAAMSRHQAAAILRFGHAAILLYDPDEAGDKGLFGENGAVKMLEGNIPVRCPEWPEGKIDPDQLTLEEVQAMVEGDFFGAGAFFS